MALGLLDVVAKRETGQCNSRDEKKKKRKKKETKAGVHV